MLVIGYIHIYIYFIPKFKKSVTLNNQFLALKYRMPDIEYPDIPDTKKTWPTLVLAGSGKSGRDNEMTVLRRWP